jgi:hypothetical protein
MNKLHAVAQPVQATPASDLADRSKSGNFIRWTLSTILLALYLWYLFDLRQKMLNDINKDVLTNLIMLFNGLEALAFTAIGWVYGREVNRARAENAEQQAKSSQDKSMQLEYANGALETTRVNALKVLQAAKSNQSSLTVAAVGNPTFDAIEKILEP